MGPAQTENKQTGMEKNNINNNRLDPKTKSKREKIQKKKGYRSLAAHDRIIGMLPSQLKIFDKTKKKTV